MKRVHPLPQRILAAALSAVYFLVHAPLSHASESNLWSDRRRTAAANRADVGPMAALPAAANPATVLKGLPAVQAQPLAPATVQRLKAQVSDAVLESYAKLLRAVPPADGSIRRISLPRAPSKGAVVFLQDVHKNDEAQRHIAAVVRSFAAAGQASFIGLEAAFSPVDLEKYRSFEDREAVRMTADYLLKQHQISGPVHAVMTHDGPVPPVVGVDDAARYKANVEAYRRAAPLADEARYRAAGQIQRLAREKKKAFNSALFAFDEAVGAYRRERMPFGNYAGCLAAVVPPAAGTPLWLFREALAMERSLDFAAVEKERARLIEDVVRKLPRAQIDRLLRFSVAYRAGELTHTDYYAALRDLCRENGVNLAAYPAMDRYVRYVMLAGRIDADKLFKDVEAAEKAAYARLAKTPAEKELAARSRRWVLVSKLLDFSLTPDEWAEYAASASRAKDMPSLAAFEAFYREADARNHAMTENLVRAMKGKPGAALLVAGGFHTAGMTKLLTGRGLAVVEVAPVITKVEGSPSAYLGVFTQERTPLEKLFAAPKLSVADVQRGLEDGAAALGISLAAARRAGDASKAGGFFSRLWRGELTGVRLRGDDRAEGQLVTPNGRARVVLKIAGGAVVALTVAMVVGLRAEVVGAALKGLTQQVHFASGLLAAGHLATGGAFYTLHHLLMAASAAGLLAWIAVRLKDNPALRAAVLSLLIAIGCVDGRTGDAGRDGETTDVSSDPDTVSSGSWRAVLDGNTVRIENADDPSLSRTIELAEDALTMDVLDGTTLYVLTAKGVLVVDMSDAADAGAAVLPLPADKTLGSRGRGDYERHAYVAMEVSDGALYLVRSDATGNGEGAMSPSQLNAFDHQRVVSVEKYDLSDPASPRRVWSTTVDTAQMKATYGYSHPTAAITIEDGVLTVDMGPDGRRQVRTADGTRIAEEGDEAPAQEWEVSQEGPRSLRIGRAGGSGRVITLDADIVGASVLDGTSMLYAVTAKGIVVVDMSKADAEVAVLPLPADVTLGSRGSGNYERHAYAAGEIVDGALYVVRSDATGNGEGAMSPLQVNSFDHRLVVTVEKHDLTDPASPRTAWKTVVNTSTMKATYGYSHPTAVLAAADGVLTVDLDGIGQRQVRMDDGSLAGQEEEAGTPAEQAWTVSQSGNRTLSVSLNGAPPRTITTASDVLGTEVLAGTSMLYVRTYAGMLVVDMSNPADAGKAILQLPPNRAPGSRGSGDYERHQYAAMDIVDGALYVVRSDATGNGEGAMSPSQLNAFDHQRVVSVEKYDLSDPASPRRVWSTVVDTARMAATYGYSHPTASIAIEDGVLTVDMAADGQKKVGTADGALIAAMARRSAGKITGFAAIGLALLPSVSAAQTLEAAANHGGAAHVIGQTFSGWSALAVAGLIIVAVALRLRAFRRQRRAVVSLAERLQNEAMREDGLPGLSRRGFLRATGAVAAVGASAGLNAACGDPRRFTTETEAFVMGPDTGQISESPAAYSVGGYAETNKGVGVTSSKDPETGRTIQSVRVDAKEVGAWWAAGFQLGGAALPERYSFRVRNNGGASRLFVKLYGAGDTATVTDPSTGEEVEVGVKTDHSGQDVADIALPEGKWMTVTVVRAALSGSVDPDKVAEIAIGQERELEGGVQDARVDIDFPVKEKKAQPGSDKPQPVEARPLGTFTPFPDGGKTDDGSVVPANPVARRALYTPSGDGLSQDKSSAEYDDYRKRPNGRTNQVIVHDDSSILVNPKRPDDPVFAEVEYDLGEGAGKALKALGELKFPYWNIKGDDAPIIRLTNADGSKTRQFKMPAIPEGTGGFVRLDMANLGSVLPVEEVQFLKVVWDSPKNPGAVAVDLNYDPGKSPDGAKPAAQLKSIGTVTPGDTGAVPVNPPALLSLSTGNGGQGLVKSAAVVRRANGREMRTYTHSGSGVVKNYIMIRHDLGADVVEKLKGLTRLPLTLHRNKGNTPVTVRVTDSDDNPVGRRLSVDDLAPGQSASVVLDVSAEALGATVSIPRYVDVLMEGDDIEEGELAADFNVAPEAQQPQPQPEPQERPVGRYTRGDTGVAADNPPAVRSLVNPTGQGFFEDTPPASGPDAFAAYRRRASNGRPMQVFRHDDAPVTGNFVQVRYDQGADVLQKLGGRTKVHIAVQRISGTSPIKVRVSDGNPNNPGRFIILPAMAAGEIVEVELDYSPAVLGPTLPLPRFIEFLVENPADAGAFAVDVNHIPAQSPAMPAPGTAQPAVLATYGADRGTSLPSLALSRAPIKFSGSGQGIRLENGAMYAGAPMQRLSYDGRSLTTNPSNGLNFVGFMYDFGAAGRPLSEIPVFKYANVSKTARVKVEIVDAAGVRVNAQGDITGEIPGHSRWFYLENLPGGQVGEAVFNPANVGSLVDANRIALLKFVIEDPDGPGAFDVAVGAPAVLASLDRSSRRGFLRVLAGALAATVLSFMAAASPSAAQANGAGLIAAQDDAPLLMGLFGGITAVAALMTVALIHGKPFFSGLVEKAMDRVNAWRDLPSSAAMGEALAGALIGGTTEGRRLLELGSSARSVGLLHADGVSDIQAPVDPEKVIRSAARHAGSLGRSAAFRSGFSSAFIQAAGRLQAGAVDRSLAAATDLVESAAARMSFADVVALVETKANVATGNVVRNAEDIKALADKLKRLHQDGKGAALFYLPKGAEQALQPAVIRALQGVGLGSLRVEFEAVEGLPLTEDAPPILESAFDRPMRGRLAAWNFQRGATRLVMHWPEGMPRVNDLGDDSIFAEFEAIMAFYSPTTYRASLVIEGASRLIQLVAQMA